VSKENKENAVFGKRKKWDINPDLPVVLPPWSECDCNDSSNTESVLPTPTKASVTFTICKGDDASEAETEDFSLHNKTRTIGGPVNITNNINSTKQNEKKDVRRSLQVVSKTTGEKKKKAQHRKSMDVKRAKAKSLPGLPQRKLTLKKPTATSVQHKGVRTILYMICLCIYLFIYRTIALCQ